jgi:hypothetical protein
VLTWYSQPALSPSIFQPRDFSVLHPTPFIAWDSPTVILTALEILSVSSATPHLHTMADSAAAPPKPSSSVKLVLLGEAAVGKVRTCINAPAPSPHPQYMSACKIDSEICIRSHPSSSASSTTISKKTRSLQSAVRPAFQAPNATPSPGKCHSSIPLTDTIILQLHF